LFEAQEVGAHIIGTGKFGPPRTRLSVLDAIADFFGQIFQQCEILYNQTARRPHGLGYAHSG
jgi:hypothetical protein